MSNSFRKNPKKIDINSILKKDIFSNNIFQLDKALNSTTNLNSNLKLYVPNIITKQFSKSIQQLRKRIKSSELKIIEKSKLRLLNESIISIFHNVDDSFDKSMQIFGQSKKENNLFLKKFKNLQKNREKISRRKNNSAIIKPVDFRILDDLVKKYKMKNILITNKMFKNKDIYRSTPILLKNKRDMEFFYLFNHDKYFKNTNQNCLNSSSLGDCAKIKSTNEKNINYEKLKAYKFFKKIILLSKKRLKELEKNGIKEHNEESINSNNEYSNNDINLNYNSIIQKEKEEINKIIKNINLLNKSKNNEDSQKDKYINKFLKKYNNNNDISLSLDSFSTYSKRTNIPIKNSFYFINNKINSSQSDKNKKLKKAMTPRNPIKNKSKLYERPNSPPSPFISIKKLKNEFFKKSKTLYPKKYQKKSNISPNTKSTFYSNKNKSIIINNKNNNVTNFEIMKTLKKKNINKFDKLIENLKNTENVYELIKKMTFENKEKALKKIEEYYSAKKEYNLEKIKKNIKQKDLYNFLDRIKTIINKYNSKKKIESLNLSIHKIMPEKIKDDLEEISNLDRNIQSAEYMYYLILLKGQS